MTREGPALNEPGGGGSGDGVPSLRAEGLADSVAGCLSCLPVVSTISEAPGRASGAARGYLFHRLFFLVLAL